MQSPTAPSSPIRRRYPLADAFRARNDSIRTLYEDTLVPVREIARLVGVTERNIYALVRRLGCRPRLPLDADGRRVAAPVAPEAASDLNSESVQRCADAVAQVKLVAASTRAARDERIALRRESRRALAEVQTLASLVRSLCDLKAIADGEASGKGQRIRASQAKPSKRRGYQWRPLVVSPTGVTMGRWDDEG